MRVSEESLLALISGFYDSARSPRNWPVAIKGLAEALGADAAALEVHNFQSATSRPFVTVTLEGSRDHGDFLAAKNLLHQGGESLLQEGAIQTRSITSVPEDRNGYHQPSNIRHIIGSVVLRRSSIAAILALTRSETKAPFSDADRQTLQKLVPHLQIALQLHDKICRIEDQRRDLTEALDLIAFGIILVDANGKILRSNRAADLILRKKDGLSAGPEGLRIAKHEEADVLRMILARATEDSRHGIRPGGALSVHRPSMRRDYSLLICPMGPRRATATTLISAPLVGTRPVAAVFITDPESQTEPPAQLLMRLYNLSPAEARLAVFLIEGRSLTEAAKAIGTSRNTVHSQLMSIFSKTGTRRQSELIKLLIRGTSQLHLVA